jgi:hypothetical protein
VEYERQTGVEQRRKATPMKLVACYISELTVFNRVLVEVRTVCWNVAKALYLCGVDIKAYNTLAIVVTTTVSVCAHNLN